jgi:hypothetical protein
MPAKFQSRLSRSKARSRASWPMVLTTANPCTGPSKHASPRPRRALSSGRAARRFSRPGVVVVGLAIQQWPPRRASASGHLCASAQHHTLASSGSDTGPEALGSVRVWSEGHDGGIRNGRGRPSPIQSRCLLPPRCTDAVTVPTRRLRAISVIGCRQNVWPK